MHKILVTTDTSQEANQAVRHARPLAAALNASLIVLAVEPDPIPPLVAQAGINYYPAVTEEQISAEHNAFRRELLQTFPDLPICIEPQAGRPVHDVILEVANREQADLLVMSTQGRGGLGRLILGSVAEAVVRHSHLPVLLIKGTQQAVNWNQ